MSCCLKFDNFLAAKVQEFQEVRDDIPYNDKKNDKFHKNEKKNEKLRHLQPRPVGDCHPYGFITLCCLCCLTTCGFKEGGLRMRVIKVRI